MHIHTPNTTSYQTNTNQNTCFLLISKEGKRKKRRGKEISVPEGVTTDSLFAKQEISYFLVHFFALPILAGLILSLLPSLQVEHFPRVYENESITTDK
jgi:hypothetical protein